MADGKQELPNLKICIENAEDSENEDVSFDDREDEVEFSVPLDDQCGGFKAMNSKPKKYDNESGMFITDLDVADKEEVKKTDERAKCFGLESLPEIDIKAVYVSLGIKEEDLHKDERGIRLNTIHVRGVNDMSTEDVFSYFKEFSPGSVEWIEDNSCNIVWLETLTAARAILKLSKSKEDVMDEVKQKKESSGTSVLDDVEMPQAEITKSSTCSNLASESRSHRHRTFEKSDSEEDDDDLDLTKDEENSRTESSSPDGIHDEITPSPETCVPTAVVESSETLETNGLQDESNSSSSNTHKEANEKTKDIELLADKSSRESASCYDFQDISWPPGKWRLGLSHEKAKILFMRYATKADKKLPGAEKRSKYYMKYGNPNYGGMTGLISKSRKRKMRAEETKDPPEVTEEAIHSSKEILKSLESDSRLIDLSNSDVSKDSEELDSDPEMNSTPVKTRMMRMYADDVEDELKAKRAALRSNILTDAWKRIPDGGVWTDKVKDARQLLSASEFRSSIPAASDLRTKLQQKRKTPQGTSHYPPLKIKVFD